MAPAGTPAAVISRLNKEVVAVVKSPDAADALNKAGAEPVTSTPAELASMVREGVKKYAATVKRAGVKLE
jgi:tripartite-type tricarboxylate transporter receptor subunit TctC